MEEQKYNIIIKAISEDLKEILKKIIYYKDLTGNKKFKFANTTFSISKGRSCLDSEYQIYIDYKKKTKLGIETYYHDYNSTDYEFSEDIIEHLPFMIDDINQLIKQRKEVLENYKLDVTERVNMTKDINKGMEELNQ